MRVLFLFLDGVGLGDDNPEINPFARAATPAIQGLLDSRKLVVGSAPYKSSRATLIALDSCMGVAGLPQSATGQAALLTGLNVPELVGEHYGPKPNQVIADVIVRDNIFKRIVASDKSAALLNAYPSRYFQSVESGKRLYSAIPLAVTSAGIQLFTKDDLYLHEAMSADFTGEGWRSMLGYDDAPVRSSLEAGKQLGKLAQKYDFSMFEYWATDYAGHGQEMNKSVDLVQNFDRVLGGLLEVWSDKEGLIVITSDHGNLEDLSTRRHTGVTVPCLVIGEEKDKFCEGLVNLAGVAEKIERIVCGY